MAEGSQDPVSGAGQHTRQDVPAEGTALLYTRENALDVTPREEWHTYRKDTPTSAIRLDAAGNPYPIADDVFRATYVEDPGPTRTEENFHGALTRLRDMMPAFPVGPARTDAEAIIANVLAGKAPMG